MIRLLLPILNGVRRAGPTGAIAVETASHRENFCVH